MDEYENDMWLLERQEEAYQDYLQWHKANCEDESPLNFYEWSDS